MLRTIPPHRDLDQYVFLDLARARDWLAACPEANAWYTVQVVEVHYSKRPCQHCGMQQEYYHGKRTLSVTRFLEAYGEARGSGKGLTVRQAGGQRQAPGRTDASAKTEGPRPPNT